MPLGVHELESTQDEFFGIESSQTLVSSSSLEVVADTPTETLIVSCDSSKSETYNKVDFNKMPPEQGPVNEIELNFSNLCNSNGNQPTLDVELKMSSHSTKEMNISNGDIKPSDDDSAEIGGSKIVDPKKANSSREYGIVGKILDIRNFFFKTGSNKRASDSESAAESAAKRRHLEEEEEPKRMTNGRNDFKTDELTQKIIAGIIFKKL